MSNHNRILLVEDDKQFTKIVVGFLSKNGYKVDTAGTASEMFKKVDKNSYSCLIIDLTLPDEDGIVITRKLRVRSQVGILVLTGREEMEDRLACFNVGADDFITKPVDPRELLVRVQAVIRRTSNPKQNIDTLHLGPVFLDHTRHEAVHENGSAVGFTPAEFTLLWTLANADGKLFTRAALVDAISTGDGPISYRAIDILVSRIRKKLDKGVIVTVPNKGYKCGWRDNNSD
ncbi:MAG: response regulator transcription factor [Magnetococcales bacterium]|nr:response regulator transcription factor [Magnetococcales bacterium]